MAVKNEWINTPEGAQENDLENGLSADQVIAAMRAAGQAPNPEPVQTANVVAGASSSIANGGINAKPVEEETKDEDGDGVPDAQTQYDAAKENYDRVNAEIAEENAKIRAEQNRTFTDMMNEEYDRQQEERRRMRIQEQANMMSGMATNTTELAAGIINLFSVGQLHANNQQYRTSTDWMAKADRDMREHRMRHDNMGATMQRLKLQQQQVATAGRIEDMKVRQAQAQAALRDAERAKALDDKERMEKADRDANMLIRGFVPDESDPSGYRFDPNLAQQLADSKKAAKTGVSGVGKTSGGAKAVTGSASPNYGLRNDGVTQKGNGYLGPLETADGKVATEYTIGVDFDGKEVDIPTLVPTLTKEEVDLMVNDIIPNNKPVPEAIVQKAVDHAKKRMAEGKSVYADNPKGNAPAAQAKGGQAASSGNANQQGAKKRTANGGKGFKDWAYRMPHTEKEYHVKRNLSGWEDPKAGTPIVPPKPAVEEKPKKTGTWEDMFN